MNRNTPKNPTRAPDPRPARTRAAILDAIELLGANHAELTVAGVVAEAGISRSSFYSQFKDMNDVAVQLISELHNNLEPLDLSALDPESIPTAVKQSLEVIISEFGNRRGLYSAVLGEGSTLSVYRELAQIIAEGTLANTRSTAPDGIDSSLAMIYTASGLLACIASWLQEEEPRSTEELLQQIYSLLPYWVIQQAS